MGKILHPLLAALVLLTTVSGLIKVVGIRFDFMRITQVEFEEWQITSFGAIQILVGILVAIPRTRKVGLIVYSSIYLFAAYFYYRYDLSPIFIPILLTITPLILIGQVSKPEDG